MLNSLLSDELPILGADRLLLPKMQLDDATDIFEYASDPEVTKYTIWPGHDSITVWRQHKFEKGTDRGDRPTPKSDRSRSGSRF